MNESQLKLLESYIEEAFNPTAKAMRKFIDKVKSGPLINDIIDNTTSCIQSGYINAVSNEAKPEKIKSKRGPTKAAPEESRCNGLVYDLEENDSGDIIPARCKRSGLNGGQFCKQHGSIDGTKNIIDSEHYGKDIIHEFKWGHLGTVAEPSYIFEKMRTHLLKVHKSKIEYSSDQNKSYDEPNINIINNTTNKYKNIANKQKRNVANGYIYYKTTVFSKIRDELVNKNPKLTGRDLVTSVTKYASDKWSKLSDSEKAVFKALAIDKKNDTLSINIDNEDGYNDNDTDIEIPQLSDDDDIDTLIFDENFQVWIDTNNNLCYKTKDVSVGPCGRIQRGIYINLV